MHHYIEFMQGDFEWKKTKMIQTRGSQPGAKWPPWGPRDNEGGPRVQNRILGGHGRF